MAKHRGDLDSNREHLRRRILAPLGVGLAVLVGTFVFSLVRVQEEQIHEAIERQLIGVEDLIALEIFEKTELMSVLIDRIIADPVVYSAWEARNRELLHSATKHYLREYEENFRIRHINLIEPSKFCFLCVHEPECLGDSVLHYTLADAAQNQSLAHGLEIGEYGRLNLRVAKPWFHDQKLVGYIELGQDLEELTQELKATLGVNLLVTIQKEFLDSASWKEGCELEGRPDSWNRFREFVVIDSTLNRIPDHLDDYMVAKHQDHEHTSFEMQQDGRPFMGRPLSLIDAGGRDIGDILVIQDVSGEESAMKTLATITVVSGVVVGALLFGLFYIILGRMESKLHRTREDWTAEMAKRRRMTRELADHNEFMSNVIESLTHPFYVIDAKSYRIVMSNSATGLSDPQQGVTCHEFSHHKAEPCCGPDHLCPMTEVKRTKQPVVVEHMHFDAKGNETLVEVHGYPILDESGEVIQLIEYSLDITERKRIEKELTRSRTHSRMIIETASDAYVAIDSEGLVTDWNRAAEKMFGWLSGEALGKPLSDLIIHDDMINTDSYVLAHCIRTGLGPILNKRVEVTARHRNGLPFPVEITVWATSRDSEVQYNAFIADITERKLAEEEIRKFKTIADNASYGLAIAGLDSKYIYTNASFARMHGRDPEWFVGKRVLRTLTKSSKTKAYRIIRKLVEDHQVQPEEFWYQHKDGHKFPGLLSPVLIPDAEGNPAFVAAVLVDISEQKRAEEQLRKSEEQFRNLFEQSNDAILVHKATGRIIEANKRSSEMLGYDRNELRDVLMLDLHPTDERANLEQALSIMLKQKTVDFQTKCQKKDGSVIDVEISSRIMDTKLGVIQSVVRDISERVRQEGELRKLSAAVNQSANLICISNPEGIIEYVNPEYCRATGYSLEEAVGCQWNLLEPERSDDRLYSEIWTQISDGQTWSGNIRNRRKDNEMFWARMTVTPVFNDDQQIVNHLTVIEDITNELAAQQGLAEADKLSAIGTLAAGVAHEFKNYLAGIMGNASYALTGLDDSDGMDLARESLEQIVELGERANDVAMSLLTYSKAEPDVIASEDLRTIIENSIRLVEKEIRNHSIEILTHFEDLPKVKVSASKIQQVLLNLIINAQHAIDSKGVITIGLMLQDDLAIIKVSDTGKGIPAAHCSKIFDPFYSTKGVWGRDGVTGTGMGLSICRNIAREHNGYLTVESVVGVGSTFVLSIPTSTTEDSPEKTSSRENDPLKLLLFTSNENLTAEYKRQASSIGSVLQNINDVDSIGDDLNAVADAVICDARLPAREKLHRMLEVCHKFEVPVIIVNGSDSGFCETALEHKALSLHPGIPTLEVLTKSLRSPSTPELKC